MRFAIFILAAFLTLLAVPAQAVAPTPNAPASFADLAERLLPAVVNISSTSTVTEPGDDGDDDGGDNQGGGDDQQGMQGLPPGFQQFFQQYMQKYGQQPGQPAQPPQAIPMASLGSGFVIDAVHGYIVTNSHVVKDATDVRVTFHDDSSEEAEVVGRDEKMDLAVLRVKTDGKHLTAVPFGDSDKQRVGDWVIAIGNPFGLGGTVTAGIISAQQRDIQAGPYDDFIQTDASINRGNSGGPMFNMAGEVIGINTAIFSPSGGSVGIGFAIPSDLAKPVINQLIQFGHTKRGWLGVRIQAVTDEIAEGFGANAPHGALVAEVTANGPAAKAGLKVGDIITSFNSHPVTEMRQLPRIVAETPIGSHVSLTYWRAGKNYSANVDVGELEKAEQQGLVSEKEAEQAAPTVAKGTDIASVGMTVKPINAAEREQFRIPDSVTGVLITAVEPAGEAGMKGLAPGDVVVEADQQPVKTPEDAAKVFSHAAASGKGSILLLLNREGDVRFAALKLKGKDALKPETNPPPPAEKTPPGAISPGLTAPGQAAPGQPQPAPIKP